LSVTIEDVAKDANVSKATVSRVINNNSLVSERTQKKVLNSINKLGYRPNHIAQSLSNSTTNFIGIIVPDIRNPFYSKAIWHIEKILKNKGYKIFICNTNYCSKQEEVALNELIDHRVDGIISITGENCETLKNIAETTDINLVLVDRASNSQKIKSVLSDNFTGGKIATNYLINSGHKNIAFISSGFSKAARQRKDGYIKALKDNNIEVNKRFIIIKPDDCLRKNNYEDVLKLIGSASPPSAIFACNDHKALEIINILINKGYKIPENISIIGYDDIEYASLANLTTVKQPIEKIINYAVSFLLKKDEYNANNKLIPPKLIERNTVGKL